MLIIRSVRPLVDHWVELTLSDGTRIDRDLDDLLRGSVFATIRTDDAAFRRLRIRHGTVVWPGDIDLDPSVLIWNGPRPRPESGARPERRLVIRHQTLAPHRST